MRHLLLAVLLVAMTGCGSDPPPYMTKHDLDRWVLTFEGHKSRVETVAFSPDDKRVASAGNSNGRVRVWDSATGQETRTLQGHESTVSSLAFSPDGKRIVTGSWDKTLKVWESPPVRS